MNTSTSHALGRRPICWRGWAGILFLAGSSLCYGIAPGDVVDMIQTRQNRVYEDCRIFKVDPDGLMFSHKAGAAKILYADMNGDTLRRVGYDTVGDHAEASKRATTVSPQPMVLTGGNNGVLVQPMPPPMAEPMTPGPWMPQYIEPVNPDEDNFGLPIATLWAPDLTGGFGDYNRRHCWSPFRRAEFTTFASHDHDHSDHQSDHGHSHADHSGHGQAHSGKLVETGYCAISPWVNGAECVGGGYNGNRYWNGYGNGNGAYGTAFYGRGYYNGGANCGSTSVSPVVQAPFWAVSPMRPAWLGTTQAVRHPVAPRPAGFNRPVPVGRVR